MRAPGDELLVLQGAHQLLGAFAEIECAVGVNAIAGLFDEFTAGEMTELEALVGKLLTALRERGQRA